MTNTANSFNCPGNQTKCELEDLRLIALVLATDVYDVKKRGNLLVADDVEISEKLKDTLKGIHLERAIPYSLVPSDELEEEAKMLELTAGHTLYNNFVYYLNENSVCTITYREKGQKREIERKLRDFGYKVQLYKWQFNTNEGPSDGYPDYIIAFAGSDDPEDWYRANPGTAFNLRSKQFNYAQNIGSALKKGTKKSVLFTGHSLGGGLAACAVLQTDKKQAIVFNSSGMATPYYRNRDDLKDFGRERKTLQEQDILSLLKENKPLILDYFMKHDPLTWLQSDGRLPPGSSICIDDDDFTLEEGDIYNLSYFGDKVKVVLRKHSISGYVSWWGLSEKRQEYFKKKCAEKNGLFQGLGLGKYWIMMYVEYSRYYGKQIERQELHDGICTFMWESLFVYLRGRKSRKIEVMEALEETASFLESNVYVYERLLFIPITNLLRDLKDLMDPYADHTIVWNDHTRGRLLDELPEYIGRMDERIQQAEQKGPKE